MTPQHLQSLCVFLSATRQATEQYVQPSRTGILASHTLHGLCLVLARITTSADAFAFRVEHGLQMTLRLSFRTVRSAWHSGHSTIFCQGISASSFTCSIFNRGPVSRGTHQFNHSFHALGIPNHGPSSPPVLGPFDLQVVLFALF